MKNADFYAAALMHPDTGDVIFYTGRAGEKYVSGDRSEAFFGYSESGAQRQAEKLAARGALAGYIPFTVQHGARVKNPATLHIDIDSHNAKGQTVTARNPTPRIKKSQLAKKPSQLTGEAPSPRLVKRRKKTAAQSMPGVWANPLTRVKVKGAPQRGGEMTDRLKARRKTTQKAPPGFYANPASHLRAAVGDAMQYVVAGNDTYLACFPHRPVAEEYRKLLKAAHPSRDFYVLPLD